MWSIIRDLLRDQKKYTPDCWKTGCSLTVMKCNLYLSTRKNTHTHTWTTKMSAFITIAKIYPWLLENRLQLHSEQWWWTIVELYYHYSWNNLTSTVMHSKGQNIFQTITRNILIRCKNPTVWRWWNVNLIYPQERKRTHTHLNHKMSAFIIIAIVKIVNIPNCMGPSHHFPNNYIGPCFIKVFLECIFVG